MIKEYDITDEHTGRDVEVLTHTIDELERVKRENAELLEKIDELTTKCRRLEDGLNEIVKRVQRKQGLEIQMTVTELYCKHIAQDALREIDHFHQLGKMVQNNEEIQEMYKLAKEYKK